jgi:hypothetical protein
MDKINAISTGIMEMRSGYLTNKYGINKFYNVDTYVKNGKIRLQGYSFLDDLTEQEFKYLTTNSMFEIKNVEDKLVIEVWSKWI